MRASTLLLEYDRSQTVKNYGQKILAVAAKDRSIDFMGLTSQMDLGGERGGRVNVQQVLQNPEAQQVIVNHIMGVIEASDPTKNKNYAQAITRLYTLGGTMLEDIESTLSQYLVKFDKLKNKKKIPAPFNDFMRYKSLNEFMTAVEAMPDPDSDIEQQKLGAIELPPHDSWRYVYGSMDQSGRITSDVLVIQPLNKYAGYWWAKEYPKKGVTNRWCTAWEGDNSRFDYYAKQGPLYIIIPAKRGFDDEKFQFHFETKQFMDYQDHQIGDQGMDALAQRFPALQKLFQKQAIEYNLLGLMTDDYKAAVRAHSKVASKELDSLIEQYKERIAGFGFSSLGDYGISIPEDTQRELIPMIENYLEQCRAALVTKDGFWRQVVNKLGTERNEDKLEVILNTDTGLKSIAENSEAGQAIKDIAEHPAISKKIDASHLQDLLLRDPLFRFTMRQVPKLYKEFLDQLNAGQVNEGVAENFDAQAAASKEAEIGRLKAQLKNPNNSFDDHYKITRQIQKLIGMHTDDSVLGKDVAEGQDDDEMFSDEGFFVVIASENEGAFVGMINKDGGRWRETAIDGNPPGNWGGAYMSYLTPEDVMQHIRNDYRRGYEVKGPFDEESEAVEYARSHYDLGGYDEFDDEDLDEGGVKDLDIQRQERDEMNPQQFRAGYGMSQSDWDADNKGKFAAPKAAKATAENKVEAYMEVYNKRDQREFVTMAFPTESSARKWANKHNAIVHSVQPINPMDESAMDGEPEPEEVDNGLIGGRYDPDEFDAMVSRVGAKAKEQELKHGKVDIGDLAKRLRAIDTGYDK